MMRLVEKHRYPPSSSAAVCVCVQYCRVQYLLLTDSPLGRSCPWVSPVPRMLRIRREADRKLVFLLECLASCTVLVGLSVLASDLLLLQYQPSSPRFQHHIACCTVQYVHTYIHTYITFGWTFNAQVVLRGRRAFRVLIISHDGLFSILFRSCGVLGRRRSGRKG